MTTTTHTVTVNANTTREREEVVRPLKAAAEMTLVAYIRGSSVATRWVKTNRIKKRAD